MGSPVLREDGAVLRVEELSQNVAKEHPPPRLTATHPRQQQPSTHLRCKHHTFQFPSAVSHANPRGVVHTRFTRRWIKHQTKALSWQTQPKLGDPFYTSTRDFKWTRQDSNSFTWQQPRNNQIALQVHHFDAYSKTCYKKLVTHSESHAT